MVVHPSIPKVEGHPDRSAPTRMLAAPLLVPLTEPEAESDPEEDLPKERTPQWPLERARLAKTDP